MTTLTIPITAYSIQSSRPGHPFRQMARMPVKKQAGAILLRAPLTKIPAGATVTDARLRFRGRSDESGSRTGKVQSVSSRWDSNVTWGRRPDTSGTITSVSKSSPQARDLWEWVVTAQVQQVVSGTRVDRGWQLWTDDDVWWTLAGSKAAAGAPRLIVEFTMTPPAPEGLHPSGGEVGVSHPVLTFDAVDDITSLRVQVDAAMNGTTPGFDSGTVAAAGGYLDLAGTAYAGVTVAGSFWRALQSNGGGPSAWSDWASFSLLAKPLLTLLSPTGLDVEDGTPVFQWSFAGVQVAWQARLFNASGDVIADSGYTPGTETDWTPERGFTRDGQLGSFELKVWDDSERIATAGDPEYVRLVHDLRLVLSDAVAPVDGLTAVFTGRGVPEVLLSGTRAEIPDEVDVFRDEVKIARYAGEDVFLGNSFEVRDVFVSPGLGVTYRVAPRVNGVTAAGGNEITVAPFAHGVWIFDAENPADRVVIGGEVPEQTQPEQAVLHSPLTAAEDGESEVVRRKLARFRPQGTIAGSIGLVGPDRPGFPSSRECERLLREWADRDAGHPYIVAFSGFCGHAIIGDIVLPEQDNPRQERSRELGVSLNYWGRRPPA